MFTFTASTGVSFMMLCLFAVVAIGYLLGRVSIKGLSLGTAGVFIVALVFGCLFYQNLSGALTIGGQTFVKEALKIVAQGMVHRLAHLYSLPHRIHAAGVQGECAPP